MIKVNVKIGAGENVLVGSESNLYPETVDAISEGDIPDVVVIHLGAIRLEVVEPSIASLAKEIADARGCVVEFVDEDKTYRFKPHQDGYGPTGPAGDPGPSEPGPEGDGGEKISLAEIAELERLADGEAGAE